jgi:glycosyltransferase involved in cell wall biosynthesis
LARIAADHASCLLTRPASYLRGLLFAAKLGGADAREILYHVFYFAEAIVVGRWMLRNGLQHLHVHFAVNTATVALIATRVFPISYSISVHGPNEFYGVKQYRLEEKVAGAAFLVAIGQFCRSQLMRLSSPDHWPKIHIVPLGVDPSAFPPRRPPAPAGGEANILCVGRLVPEKGQLVLVTAMAKLQARGVRARLHFAGDGPSRGPLEALARSLGVTRAVTFHGSINQDRLKGLLAIADVFVLPSFAEGIPVALMEAMSMEIPCVSTFVAGIPELIESGTDGLLVPPSDADLLADAIERLIADENRRMAIGRAGRQKVMAKYNLEPNVRRLGGVFEQHLGGVPAPSTGQSLHTARSSTNSSAD